MSRGIRSASIIAAAALVACGVGVAADQAEVSAGTTLKVRLNQTLDSDVHGRGSGFTATVSTAVFDAEGETLIPAGSVVHGKILTLQEDPPRAQLEFTDIEVRGESRAIDASLVEFAPTRKSEMKDEGKKIGGGAAAGAIVGGLAGGDVGDAIGGAVVGAAAGTGVALLTKDTHVFVPAGSILQLELLQALPVKLETESESEPKRPTD
ncbi:MAG: hypothetical protein OEM23_01990 [Gemmatimonadota bacterium]|nr:hypothetical protein [Gemmatimonadota bacterium]MDH3427180.1 hypothetical protein [Gemmatimonadota bacterium]